MRNLLSEKELVKPHIHEILRANYMCIGNLWGKGDGGLSLDGNWNFFIICLAQECKAAVWRGMWDLAAGLGVQVKCHASRVFLLYSGMSWKRFSAVAGRWGWVLLHLGPSSRPLQLYAAGEIIAPKIIFHLPATQTPNGSRVQSLASVLGMVSPGGCRPQSLPACLQKVGFICF